MNRQEQASARRRAAAALLEQGAGNAAWQSLLALEGTDDATLRARALALWALGKREAALAVAARCSVTDFSLLAQLLQAPPSAGTPVGEGVARKKLFVFLPVAVSMWDSLASVWRAAADDPAHCRTLVIPLPYADRNAEGGVADWHCDAADYPEDVPVCDWRDYPLARLRELHPDAIFIHIPYDGCNYVYSVASQYYSDQLKECTDNLIYIPYFVMGDTIPVEFCHVPAVVHADHVIVQDENIRRQYEQYYPGGNPPAGKFLALGSPKFDPVLRPRSSFQLPEAWQRLTRGRKVVLYNTSVTAVLSNDRFACRKLRAVLAYFKSRKDVAFWWRPHPFMEATLRSMRPALLQEYLAICKEYRQEGWGIYDDTGDLDRAIVCSDAYYGDASSVVWLYRATGKPIMIENFVMDDRKRYPYAYSFLPDEKGNVYLAGGHYGALAKLSTGEDRLTLIAAIPRTVAQNWFAYGTLDRIGDELLLFPINAQHVLGYSLRTRAFRTILAVPNTYSKSQRLLAYFSHAGVHVYVPLQSDHLIVYREREQRWETMDGWFAPLREALERQDAAQQDAAAPQEKTVCTDACQVGGVLYITVPRVHGILHLDIETQQSTLLPINADAHTYEGIAYDGTACWIVQDAGRALVRWDIESGAVEIVPLPQAQQSGTRYRRLLFDGEQLILFPKERGQILCIDPRTHAVTAGAEVERTLVDIRRLGTARYGWLEFGSSETETGLRLDRYGSLCIADHGQVTRFPLRGEDLERGIDPAQFTYQGFYYENIGCTLDDLLERKPQQAAAPPQYGRAIYEAVCQRVESKDRSAPRT